MTLILVCADGCGFATAVSTPDQAVVPIHDLGLEGVCPECDGALRDKRVLDLDAELMRTC